MSTNEISGNTPEPEEGQVPKDELDGLVDESTGTDNPYLAEGFDGIQDDAFKEGS